MTNSQRSPLKPLQKGSVVDVIAPSWSTPREHLEKVRELLISWDLVPRISDDIFGDDLLCSNSDELRFKHLEEALTNNESQAVWCIRGGYGAAKLIPRLLNVKPPKQNKLFIGFSDITALHVFLQQKWNWSTLHGPGARQIATQNITQENIDQFKDLIFGVKQQIEFNDFIPLNKKATENKILTSHITGGNLSLLQNSIGTPWEINVKNSLLVLEDVNERGYRIDRMLEHLKQANVLPINGALIFCDFIVRTEINETELIQKVLKRFAEECDFPVLRTSGIGHGKVHHTLPFGTDAFLTLGKNPSLKVNTGIVDAALSPAMQHD